MTYLICSEDEATHVKVLRGECESFKIIDVTPGRVYEMKKDTEPQFEGEEMLVNDKGELCACFSMVVPVIYLKEEIEV